MVFTDPRPCLAAAFSPDGSRVLCARHDGRLDVSPSRDTDAVLARARSLTLRAVTDQERSSFAIGPARRP
jgi:hypothetical protein